MFPIDWFPKNKEVSQIVIGPKKLGSYPKNEFSFKNHAHLIKLHWFDSLRHQKYFGHPCRFVTCISLYGVWIIAVLKRFLVSNEHCNQREKYFYVNKFLCFTRSYMEVIVRAKKCSTVKTILIMISLSKQNTSSYSFTQRFHKRFSLYTFLINSE